MDDATTFADAADVYDWWFFSGTALGATTPGETFKLLDAQLTEAGANAVIAARFLDENEGGIDLPLWRGAFVFGHVGLQISLTLRALEAIGASGIVSALRTAPAKPSILSQVQEMVGSGTIDHDAIARLTEELRRNLAAGASHVLGTPAPDARPTPGVESVEDVRRLLDAYVSAHRADLARDVAKYGDPRKRPGFDPERAREDRARQVKRLSYLSYQRGAIDGLREQLGRLTDLAGKEPPESPRLNKALRKVVEGYEGFAGKPPEDLTPEVEAWLREVEVFRRDHAEALSPKASRDDRVNARLAAIGPHEVSFEREAPSIWWDEPAGLDCDWTDLGLSFGLVLAKKPAPARVASALDALCDEVDRLRARWPEIREELRRYLLDLFRGTIAGYLPEDERAAFVDDDGSFSEAKILGAVEHGTIAFRRHSDEPVRVEFGFHVSWDEEHPVEVEFDEDGRICRDF